MQEKKHEPCPIVIGILAIAFIVYMWVEKDIASTYTALPKEQLLPVILTSAAVTLLKAAAMAGGILLVNWIIGKFKNDKSQRPLPGLWLFDVRRACSIPAASR